MEAQDIEYWDNGKIKEETEHYESGRKSLERYYNVYEKIQTEYQYRDQDVCAVSRVIFYYPNGSKKTEKNLDEYGEKTFRVEFREKGGKPKWQEEYREWNILYRKVEFNEFGNPQLEKKYDKKGELNYEIEYWNNGNKKQHKSYNMSGQLFKEIYYDEEGIKKEEKKNLYDRKLRIERQFHENGETKHERIYHDGILTLLTHYDKVGQRIFKEDKNR